MKKRTALEARLKRLEERQLGNPLKRQVIFALAERPRGGDDVVGMTDNFKLHLLRMPQEPIDAFERRAGAVSGARVLFRVYRNPGAASERDGEAGWHNAALEA